MEDKNEHHSIHSEKKRSNSSTSDVFYSNLADGLDFLWNNKFKEAEEFFAKKANIWPRYALHYAEIPAFRSFITESDVDRTLAIERLTASISLAESHSSQYEKGHFPLESEYNEEEITEKLIKNHELDTKTVLADSYTMLAAFLVLEDSRIKGAFNLRKGWKVYDATLKEVDKSSKEDYYPSVISSLRFGAGLFFVIVSLIPPGFAQKAAALIGFRADKRLGLEYLRECSNTNSIRAHFASIVIALYNVVLTPSFDKELMQAKIKEAEVVVERGVSAYPSGSLFQLIGGLIAIELNNTEKAHTYLNAAIENSKDIASIPPIFYRVLSNCYLMSMDWPKALEVLEKVLQSSQEAAKRSGKTMSPWASSWSYLKLGSCYAVMNKDGDAKHMWTEVTKTKEGDRWTTIINKQAKKYIRTGGRLSVYEVLTLTSHLDKVLNNSSDQLKNELLASIELLAKDSKGALSQLSSSDLEKTKKGGGMLSFISMGYIGSTDENDPQLDNRCQYLYLKGCVLRSLGRNDEAAEGFNEILEYKHYLHDKLYYALGHLELGKCYHKSNPTEALRYWKDGIKINGYVWEDPIRHRFRTFMSNLGVEDVEINDGDDHSTSHHEDELMKAVEEEEKKVQSTTDSGESKKNKKKKNKKNSKSKSEHH